MHKEIIWIMFYLVFKADNSKVIKIKTNRQMINKNIFESVFFSKV